MTETDRRMIQRAVPLIDLEINRSGDGRTVTAYAATFDDPYEVRDDHGHYYETISRTAFNRQLGLGTSHVKVLFNHGLTAWGTPSERYSDPIGVPLAIRAETKGLLTVTRYGTNDLAEQVLTMLKDGSVTTYSFRGSIFRSQSAGRRGQLPIQQRTDLGLKDYGPGIYTINHNAELVAIRSATALAEEIAQLSPEERDELLAQISTRPADQALGQEKPDTQDDPPADEAPDPDPGQSTTHLIELLEAEAAQRRRRLEA